MGQVNLSGQVWENQNSTGCLVPFGKVVLIIVVIVVLVFFFFFFPEGKVLWVSEKPSNLSPLGAGALAVSR